MFPEGSNRDKGKRILCDDEIVENISKQVYAIINNAYVHKHSWSKEEHDINIVAIFEAKKIDYFQKANEGQQLQFMLDFINKIEHERIYRIGPFVPLKDDELRREKVNKPTSQNSNAPPQIPPLSLKTNILVGNMLIVQNQQPKKPPIVPNNGKIM